MLTPSHLGASATKGHEHRRTAMNRYDYTLPDHKVVHGVMVDLGALRVEAQAQRVLDENRARGIYRHLVVSAVGSLVVSERADGKRFIVDGMHRSRACQLAGITTLPAEVHYGLTVREEAILFLIKNRESKSPNAVDEFNVGLTAGLEIYSDIQQVLDWHGLTVNGGAGPNTIQAVKGLEEIVRRHGTDTLNAALTLAEAAWGRTTKTWDGTLICGLGHFIGKHGDKVDLARLKDRIESTGTPMRWLGLAESQSAILTASASAATSKRAGMVMALTVQYDKGLRRDKKLAPPPLVAA